MANDDHLPLPSGSLDSRPSSLYSSNTGMVERGGEWDGVSVPAAPAGPAAPDLTAYVHAFRRHWFLVLGIGLFCAALVGPAVWYGIGNKYTAYATLRVAMQQEMLLTTVNADNVNRDFFEIYKNTVVVNGSGFD